MDANRLAQALSLLGVAGYAYFLWFRPSQEGIALTLGLALGGAAVAYGERPFLVPLFAVLYGGILFLQLFYGHPWAFLLGGLLGAGLPYAFYRLRKPRR
ncbi:hypothetical protein GCM10007092_14190 [Thermus composti]|uniref:Uncharacterized protein n=1 Tax=Thermus composti TaxID=532059 RepID=A0ABV6Q1M2_9DEIN|nr:hypothetical protein [Thermus composti]GGN01307.1 hypothetical protein GCM10007092_14190 [Thermus composti]